MKGRFIALILTFFSIALMGQQSFYYTITTNAPTDKNITRLYVSYDIAGIKFKDSLDLSKKEFSLTKQLIQPVAAYIFTNSRAIAPISVMLANNSLSVTISENKLSVKESKLQDDFLYLTANDRIRPTYFPLYGELNAKNDTLGLQKLSVIFDSLKKDDIKKSLAYFKSDKTSLLSLFAFSRYTAFYADYSQVAPEYNELPAWAKNTPDGKAILAKIDGAKSAQINTLAKKFAQRSSTGQEVRLDDFEGKYILLDFWASWCAPCRKEHPNLINTYTQFRQKNFDIISVSLDDSKDNWLNAITKDKLPWTQVSDLKGQLNDIAVQYGVQSVPANFLIDPKGVIIDKNLTAEELSKRLNTLLGK